jgi:predicted enzyme related to lactoylglutathione lyase
MLPFDPSTGEEGSMAENTPVNSQITDFAAPEAAPGLPVGRFVWHDLMATDVAQAQQYYTDLLGWTYKNFDTPGGGGNYPMIHAAGTEWGGIIPTDPGRPAQWVSYVTVPDVDAAVAAAQAKGGQVMVPAMDIPTVGRFAYVTGPNGGTIAPFTPMTRSGETPDPAPAPGTFVWHELLARDRAADGAFFSEIFGWRTEEAAMGERGTYYIFKRLDTGKDAGGLLQMPTEAPGLSAWIPYVQVENADATAARTKDLGGKVWVEPRDIPGVGRFTVTSDPMGAMLAFLQP